MKKIIKQYFKDDSDNVYNIITFPETTDFYAVGDIHGDYNALARHIEDTGLQHCVVVCCGDIGLGFYPQEETWRLLEPVDRLCAQRDVEVVFLRGNHDDPAWYDETEKGILSHLGLLHITAVKDYTVLCGAASDHNILCVGGAVSIDRDVRIAFLSYWPDEAPVYRPTVISGIPEDHPITAMCSHSAPYWCQPLTKGAILDWAVVDGDILEDTHDERLAMALIYEWMHPLLGDDTISPCPLKSWYYGHFHDHISEDIEVEGNKVSYTMLDKCRDGRIDCVKINF